MRGFLFYIDDAIKHSNFMTTKQTFTDTAPSGFEFELSRMKAYHQEWLTSGKRQSTQVRGAKKNKSEKRVEDIMADIVVRIDDDTDITAEKILALPSWDFKYMLFVARFFSCDISFIERDDEYKKHLATLFRWKMAHKHIHQGWESVSDEEVVQAGFTKQGETEAQVVADRDAFGTWADEQDIREDDDEPVYTSQLDDHIFKFRYEYEDGDEMAHYDYEQPLHMHDFKVRKPFRSFTWEELQGGRDKTGMTCKDVEVVLPISKQKMVWHMLDLDIEEKQRGGFQPDEINVNTALKWRNPRIMNPKESEPGKFVAIQANISRLELLDIEHLRKDVFDKEGMVDSVLTIKLPGGKLVKVDVLNTTTFFIPSGVL